MFFSIEENMIQIHMRKLPTDKFKMRTIRLFGWGINQFLTTNTTDVGAMGRPLFRKLLIEELEFDLEAIQ